MEQGSGIPEDFGPVKTSYDNDGQCHIYLDMDKAKNFDKPTKITSNTPVPVKKRTTLRDAIKSSAKVAKTESEDNKNTNEIASPDAKGPKKLKKHQGKSKTFKRKTKRPGRV